MTTRSTSSANMFQIIFITALLLLFGVTTYTLVTVGGSSYRRVMEARDENAASRTALSYIGMRVRQNDVQDALAIDAANNALLLRSGDAVDAYEYRIYYYEGGLYECLAMVGQPFNVWDGAYVAPIGGLEMETFEKNGQTMLSVTVLSTGDEPIESSMTMAMRSLQNGGLLP